VSAAHAAPAAFACILLGLGVGMTLIGRGWPARPKHRAPRRPVEEWVPAHHLIPALAYGAAVPQDIAHCHGCGRPVPVTVHGDAYRCDREHITIHTTAGG
jgi:hypothetical protein